MLLKSRRGSHNLKFGGQTIPDAGGSNSKRPVADLSPSPPNDQVIYCCLMISVMSDDRQSINQSAVLWCDD